MKSHKKAMPGAAGLLARAAKRSRPKVKSWRRGSRLEKSELLRHALLQAAATVVGEVGYANASIALITAKAGVAQGTFYNYFESRQDILDKLLPTLGEEMLAHIRQCASGGTNYTEIEERIFRGFFSFLGKTPHFSRILNEAESFAPAGHKQHFDNVSKKYLRLFHRSKLEGEFPNYSEAELEVVVFILLAARSYLALRYLGRPAQKSSLPEWVAQTYMKFVRYGLEGVPPPAQRQAASATIKRSRKERASA
jgi:AcrR family transcriptional regulator